MGGTAGTSSQNRERHADQGQPDRSDRGCSRSGGRYAKPDRFREVRCARARRRSLRWLKPVAHITPFLAKSFPRLLTCREKLIRQLTDDGQPQSELLSLGEKSRLSGRILRVAKVAQADANQAEALLRAKAEAAFEGRQIQLSKVPHGWCVEGLRDLLEEGFLATLGMTVESIS